MCKFCAQSTMLPVWSVYFKILLKYLCLYLHEQNSKKKVHKSTHCFYSWALYIRYILTYLSSLLRFKLLLFTECLPEDNPREPLHVAPWSMKLARISQPNLDYLGKWIISSCAL